MILKYILRGFHKNQIGNLPLVMLTHVNFREDMSHQLVKQQSPKKFLGTTIYINLHAGR